MGIATRMRGLGNVGVYKYNHCTTIDQIKKINSEYKNDLTIGEWNYKLDNLTNADKLFDTASTIRKFNVDLPNVTSSTELFDGCYELTDLNGSVPKSTWMPYLLCDTKIREKNFEFPAATRANGVFLRCYRLTESEAKFPVATNTQGCYQASYRLTRFGGEIPLSKEIDTMFYDCYNLSNFEADIPKGSTATNMFHNCLLNKESVLRISNTLPTYTSGTHNIKLGINKELETDEEVLAAITTIKSKGWTVTTQWNTGYNGLEVLSNELNEKMELGIELPEGYTRLYYLEDLGRQWIDTGYIPSVNTGLYVIAKQIVSSAGWPIGLATHTDGATYGITAPLWPRTSSVLSMYYIYNTAAYQNYSGRGEAYEGWTNFLNNKVAKVDVRGTIYSKNLSKYTATYTHPLWISKTNAPRNTSTNTRAFNGRIYRVKISEGTEIVRDYVPALDPNGRPCMFELCEQKPYYNENPKEEFWYDFPPTNSN